MKTPVRKIWTAALRSGYFPQTRLQLRSEQGYCCLGVLTELAEKDGIVVEFYDADANEYVYVSTDDGERARYTPPQAVLDWADIHVLPDVDVLTTLNDDKGKTFSEIADYIDATYGDDDASN
jgi:hypothetical protein